MGMENTDIHREKVHGVLAHSYAVYFLLFLTGLFFDFVFSAWGGSAFGGDFFNNSLAQFIGIILLVLATILILWAQKTGHEFRKIKEKKTENFCLGPYCYTRIPTQWGLFSLMLGFGIVTNAFFVVIFSLVAFLIAKFVFIEKEERLLAQKYGGAFLEYKKLVRF